MANRKPNSTHRLPARWYWEFNCGLRSSDERKGWSEFSDIESMIIEDAFCSGNHSKLIELDNYWINLNDYTRINKYNGNERTRIKRIAINENKNRASTEESSFPVSISKPFEDSGLEGGIAFIYDWRKRNAALPNSVIAMQAANGILEEGMELGQSAEAEKLAQLLIDAKNKSENKILRSCIYLYTRASFLYVLINKTLRKNDKTKVDTLAPFCYFLTEAIWSNALVHERFRGLVYRGVTLDLNQLSRYQEAVGTYKYWYGFTSTSKNRHVGEIFGNAMFIIDISRTGALNISPYSSFSDEEEVLLPPGTTIRIDKVEQSENTGKEYIYVTVVPEVRMVLLGRTGTGKSSFGNTILGRKAFKARKAAKSITTKCGVSDRIFEDKRLVVVDTPGFFDTELSPEVIIPEICGSYQIAAPGPDVFLIVLTFDRFTPQEEAAAKWISQVFDERALDYCIIVFTGLDSLKRDDITVEEFLEDAPAFLQNLIQKCNSRYIAVDNTVTDAEKEEITKLLLEKIAAMVQNNGGQYYNNKQFVQITHVLDTYSGWFDPLKPDGTVNLLPETTTIVTPRLVAETLFSNS